LLFLAVFNQAVIANKYTPHGSNINLVIYQFEWVLFDDAHGISDIEKRCVCECWVRMRRNTEKKKACYKNRLLNSLGGNA